jgi:pimeloyl-ACP methyl ester carboxylesterase
MNIVIGLSLGGMIAAQWIHTHPTDFQAVVIINSSSSLSRFWQRMIPSGGKALLKAFSTRDISKRERTIAGLITNLADPDRVAHNWAEISRSAPISTLNTFRQLAAAATFSLPRNIGTPTLVLCSTHDRLVSPICSEDIARALTCGIVHHSMAGHDLTTDDPDWCITQIFSWLPALDS